MSLVTVDMTLTFAAAVEYDNGALSLGLNLLSQPGTSRRPARFVARHPAPGRMPRD